MTRLAVALLFLSVTCAQALSLPPQKQLPNHELLGDHHDVTTSRRRWLQFIATASVAATAFPALAAEEESMYAPKFLQSYDDFVQNPAGWSYRDVKLGTGDHAAAEGDRVVFDWSGYTIGYFGRPFQAKGGPQGGAFDKDLDYQRTVLGSGKIVKGLEQAFVGMTAGGIRQVIVPYGDLSYPPGDPEHGEVGPKPSTFSGMRALNFVLQNPRVDRSLLFNVKVVRIDRPDRSGGFKRG